MRRLVGATIVGMVLLGCTAVTGFQDSEENHPGEGIISFYYNYNILKVSRRPLFRANGGVNRDVLENLIAILDNPRLNPMMREDKTQWPTGMPFTGTPYTAITAADFSDFVVPESAAGHSGAVVIKLFETIPGRRGVEHGHLTEFTTQWWRLVYRSTDGENDVLTLWMVQPYRLTHFGGTRYVTSMGRADERFYVRQGETSGWRPIPINGENRNRSDDRIARNLPACNTYHFEANFSASIARDNLLRDVRMLLSRFNVERYLVAPRDLPGRWQSSQYQTGSNANHVFYATGQFWTVHREFPGSTLPQGGLGAAGLIWGLHRHFSLINGKDGLSIGPVYNHWPNTRLAPTHYDLFWLPSDFEIRSMGHDRDNARFQTFIAEPDNPASVLRSNMDPETRPDASRGRSGLWRLNGFDRGVFDANAVGEVGEWETRLSWLRSADGLGWGSANTVCLAGNRYSYGVHQLAGMRPGVHLSLTRLAQRLTR